MTTPRRRRLTVVAAVLAIAATPVLFGLSGSPSIGTATATGGDTVACGGTSPCPSGTSTDIAQIQGAGHLSPLVGSKVSGVTGVVTARAGNGFFMQDPRGSSAPGYQNGDSSGIFVFTSSAPAANLVPGVSVSVQGTVSEYRPGDAGLTVTELASPVVTKLGTKAPLPEAILVGPGGRTVPDRVIDNDAGHGPPINVETQGSFNPVQDGIDFWESLEGMRVKLLNARVVGPTNTDFGETTVVPPGSGIQTARGGILLRRGDPNPERVILDDRLGPAIPRANVGDTYTGRTVGVLDYAFNDYHLDVTASPTVRHGVIRRETAASVPPSQLSVATFNVENLAPTNPASKFRRLAAIVTHALKSPDLLALEEVQDNNGAVDDGTVAANVTLHRLVGAIAAAGGPSYTWQQINPVNDAEGGEPGGNIRVAFLIREDSGLHFVTRDPGDSTTATHPLRVNGHIELSHSPGRVEPGNAAWEATRVPLAGEFMFNGKRIFVVANHWSSKGGDEPLFGPLQPPRQFSEAKRTAQARVVARFVGSILDLNANANVVVLGDLNDFVYSRSVMTLRGHHAHRLLDLPVTLPIRQRYTYVYEGNSQVLDHALLSRGLVDQGYRYDVVHVNSEFSTQVSDHDPQVVDLHLG